jgi:putative mRNA 3-end processing factor
MCANSDAVPDLLTNTEKGLYCPLGGFYIDPWRPASGDRAIITHAHSDHARWGASDYLCAQSGVAVLLARLGNVQVTGVPFGEVRDIGDVRVSLHPAGHVLGSAMVRVEHKGEVWVVSGDYKTQRDCSGELMEPVACHTFITESTFGLPIYRWQSRENVGDQINAWWASNASEGATSIVYAYALGKAQSVLALLNPSVGPIYVHGAVEKFLPIYAAAGVKLPACERADKTNVKAAIGKAIIIAPPGADNSAWARKFGERREAFASGWMRVRGPRRRRGVDRGFVLSDHADWPGLLATIRATGATRVGVTHGYTSVLARYLKEQGLETWTLATRFEGESGASEEKAAEDDTPRTIDTDGS